MPLSSDVQSTIAQRYAQLADAVTHDPSQERGVLAAHFHDRARVKLTTFEYDPLTVMVEKIIVQNERLEVHARYVGVQGHNVQTVDHWLKIGGFWRLSDRNDP